MSKRVAEKQLVTAQIKFQVLVDQAEVTELGGHTAMFVFDASELENGLPSEQMITKLTRDMHGRIIVKKKDLSPIYEQE